MATEQIWTLAHEGRRHRVIAAGSTSHVVRWYVDDALHGEKRTWDDKVTVAPGSEDGDDGSRLVVRYSGLGTPRRATLHPDAGGEADLGVLTGHGGIDLVPEPGTRAAAYEQRLREHPTRYALIATAGGVAKVVVPLLVGLLAVRLAVNLPLPSIPWPDLPDLPKLPRIPWPDLPWPDWHLPDWRLPGWLRWVLDKAKYLGPVVLAYVVARAEIRRRRQQDDRRRTAEEERGERSDRD